MYIDKVIIKVTAGNGGNGAVSYRREKYVEYGGPYGGNGGKGGSIYIQADSNKDSLIDFKYTTSIIGNNGINGSTKNQNGSNGDDIFLFVPLGTQVYHNDILIGEVIEDKEIFLLCSGGKGGRGNSFFATSKNKCPDFAEKGEKGESKQFTLILKSVADIGIIGLPNAGKSSLLNALTNANAKIADYSFTTLYPNLGVLHYNFDKILICDIPGLVENASQNVGLGIDFLQHIERCRMFIHLIDGNSDAFLSYNIIRAEISQYNKDLSSRTELIVINKIDLIDQKQIRKIKRDFKLKQVLFISILKNTGLEELKNQIYTIFKDTPRPIIQKSQSIAPILEDNLVINNVNGTYFLSSIAVKKQYDKLDLNNEYSLKRFIRILRSMGIEKELKKAGMKDGDTLNVYGFEFEYYSEN